MTESGLTPADHGPGDAPPDGIQALTEEIERTREDIGETVAALAAKADLMARAREKASEVAGRLTDTAGKVKEKVKEQAAAIPPQRQVVVAAACVVLLAGVLIARHRRR
jgi:gas vesicle protein